MYIGELMVQQHHPENFQDGCFTKVFSIHSVYFWDNLPETISEIYRVLKPEGTIILTLCAGKKKTAQKTIC